MGELCIIHANCQGESLAELLAVTPEFDSRWRIRQYTNYLREPIPDAELKAARIFLYQCVGGLLQLPFAKEETAYPVFGRSMTFIRYVSRYIDCRLNKMEENFLGYLQLV